MHFDFGFSYSLDTKNRVPKCTVLCEEPLPQANNESKMTLKEIIPFLPNWAKKDNARLDANKTFNEQKHLFRYKYSLRVLSQKRNK